MSEDFNYHFGNILYKEIEYLQVRNMKLIEENQELKDRINRTINFIENGLQSYLYSIEYKTLLSLLKGDKE